jgi:hypothetical protein
MEQEMQYSSARFRELVEYYQGLGFTFWEAVEAVRAEEQEQQ